MIIICSWRARCPRVRRHEGKLEDYSDPSEPLPPPVTFQNPAIISEVSVYRLPVKVRRVLREQYLAEKSLQKRTRSMPYPLPTYITVNLPVSSWAVGVLDSLPPATPSFDRLWVFTCLKNRGKPI